MRKWWCLFVHKTHDWMVVWNPDKGRTYALVVCRRCDEIGWQVTN